MNKKMKTLSLLFALALTASSVVGCGKSSSEGKPAPETPKYESTGYKLVEKGVSEYVVLLPAEPTANEYTAAEELTYFLKLATNAELKVVEEDEYALSTDNGAIISIGDTAHAEKKNVKTDGSLDMSGYIMKTVENQLFIRSDGDGLGCVYGVYDLLENIINYRYYYTDEIYYEKKDTVYLYEYDIVEDPDFDFRALSTWNKFLHSNEDYMRRTRTFRRDMGWAWGEMHMQTRSGGIVPKDVHFDEHKFGSVKEDGSPNYWYSGNGEQLCWTAGEEMYAQAASDIIEKIKVSPGKKYFEVGQADTVTYCTCDRCEAAKAEWAMNDAGLQMHFINRVAAMVNAWVAENEPGREIRLVVFAYYATEEPPVVQDENGKWVAFSDKATPKEDNIDFYFAPIDTDYSKDLQSVTNKEVYDNLLKWYDFLEGKENEFLVWTYDTNFHYFFYNFNNFDTFTSQVQTYAKYGVDFMHSQGANGTNQPCFQEMRYFVESQILWDTTRNYDSLVDEFMGAFYKDASSEIREYYDLTRMRYEQMEILEGVSFTSIYANIGSEKIWTEGVINAIDDIFTRAYAKIEHYKQSDPVLHAKLYDRIKELELTSTYTKLKYYANNYTQDEKNRLVDEFNHYTMKFDINRIKEGGELTSGLFDDLKR